VKCFLDGIFDDDAIIATKKSINFISPASSAVYPLILSAFSFQISN